MHSAGMEKHDRLKEARKDAGFASASKAAESLNVPVPTYLAHENGSRDFDQSAAQQYARRFGVRAAWLIIGEEPKKGRAPSAPEGESPDEHKRVPLGEEFAPDPAFDDHPSIGSETGRRGIPDDGIAQIDVTGGMGGGGVSIVNPGVPGKHGMTFAAEHIRDYWRLPVEVLVALGLRAGDIAIIPVQGDSMTGTLTEGDFVFVDTRHRLPSPDGIYALTDEFGGVVVKRLEIASSPRDEDIVIRIISDNPKHAPKERALSDINIMGRVVRRFGGVG